MDTLAERLIDELCAAAGRRKRLLAVECDDALLDVAPNLQSDPGRRRRLRDLLTQLDQASLLAWSAARDRTVHPELPAFVTLADPTAAAEQAPVAITTVPWRPELEWAYTLRLTPAEHDVLLAVQAYRRDRHPQAIRIPHRERSLQLFRDEKRLDRLIRSRLFDHDRLSLDLLDAFWAAPPIAWTSTGGAGPVVVSENAASWHTLVKALHGQAKAVAYGAGSAFAQSVASLAAIGHNDTILYIGDLDAEGIAIPQRAATTTADLGLTAPRPYIELWRALSDLADEHGQAAAPVPSEVAAELCDWFGDPALATNVQNLLEEGIRVPQEALTCDVVVAATAFATPEV